MPCYSRETPPTEGGTRRKGYTSRPSLRSDAERDALTLDNTGLVHGHLRRRRLAGHPAIEDLVQAGLVGLMRACELWEPEKGKLSTFADKWIRQKVDHEMERTCIVHMPHNLSREEKLAVREQFKARRLPGSKYEGGHDYLADPRSLGDDDQGEEDRLVEAVRDALRCLPERSRLILEMRLEGATLAEVSAAIGVSKQRVQQLESGAEAKLRRLRPDLADLLD